MADITTRANILDADSSRLDGLVVGYAVDRPMTARAALEPLAAIHRFDATERNGRLSFVSKLNFDVISISLDDVAETDGDLRIARIRADVADMPLEARLRFLDETHDYRAAAASARHHDALQRRVIEQSAPIVLDHDLAEDIARAWLADAEAGAEGIKVRLPPSRLDVEAGDAIVVAEFAGAGAFRVQNIEDAGVRTLQLARATEGAALLAGSTPGASPDPPTPPARPLGLILDLPLLPSETARGGPRVAAAADPWPGDIAVHIGADAGLTKLRGQLTTPAVVGELLWDLYPGPVGRWDDGNRVRVRVFGGSLSSATPDAILQGANSMAVEGASGEWEILQYRNADLVDVETYDIYGLLRAQAGSEPGVGAPAPAGSRIVLLNGASQPLGLDDHERGGALSWTFVSADRAASDAQAHSFEATYQGVDLRPLSPVHLRARREADGVHLNWVRRTRIGGDDWTSVQVPLGEALEKYTVEIWDGGAPVWSLETGSQAAVLSTAAENSLFASAPVSQLDVSVAQISEAFGAGTSCRHILYF